MLATGKSDSSVFSLTSHTGHPPHSLLLRGLCLPENLNLAEENPLHNTHKMGIKSCIESVRELSCLGDKPELLAIGSETRDNLGRVR